VADETTRARGSAGGTFRSLLAWVVILGLLGLVGWLVSERNARTWYLVPDEGRLVVMRGMKLPVGRQPFKTDDPVLAQVYEPIVVPPGVPVPPEQGFDERSALDQALYDLVARWAREDISSGDPARLERGLRLVDRVERLPGLSGTQERDLQELRAESAYHEARRLLERASAELKEAADKLRGAAMSRSPHADDARLLLREVEPAVDSAVSALRSVRGGPTAPPARPAPGPGGATGPAAPQGSAGGAGPVPRDLPPVEDAPPARR
jgi:hypothetical protein